jgi:hypothetical protein
MVNIAVQRCAAGEFGPLQGRQTGGMVAPDQIKSGQSQ